MTWGFVGAAAVTAVGTAVGVTAQNRAGAASASAANTQAYKDYINTVNQTMEQNRAIGEANTLNTIRTGYKVGLLNLQSARLKEQAAMEGWDVSKKASEALSNAEAVGAASGNVGSSVDAVALDIRKKSAEAQIAVDNNWYDTLENQNLALNNIVQAGFDAIRTPITIPEIGSVNTRSFTGQNALAAGATAGVLAYAGSQFKLSQGTGK